MQNAKSTIRISTKINWHVCGVIFMYILSEVIRLNFCHSQPDNLETISTPELWLAASADRRVSVWSADWSKDFCELIDWLTFPAPAFTPDGTAIRQGDNVSMIYPV